MIEFLGYLGLILIGLSLAQSKMENLRTWGILSACVFLAQGILLGVSSLILVNILIIILHVRGFLKC